MLIESFLDYLHLERNYSERTIFSYQTDLREFEGYLKETEAELDWKKVHADHVRNWMVHLMESGRASTSVNRKLSSLHSNPQHGISWRTESLKVIPRDKRYYSDDETLIEWKYMLI